MNFVDFIECPICYYPMNSEKHYPILMLPCGHNICSECFNIMKPNQNFECGECKQKVQDAYINMKVINLMNDLKKIEVFSDLIQGKDFKCFSCQICGVLNDFSNKFESFHPCGHYFCEKCFEKFIPNNLCPICEDGKNSIHYINRKVAHIYEQIISNKEKLNFDEKLEVFTPPKELFQNFIKKPEINRNNGFYHNDGYFGLDPFRNPQPVNPQPIRPQPVNPQPVNPQPIRPQPVNPQPVNPQPVNPLPRQINQNLHHFPLFVQESSSNDELSDSDELVGNNIRDTIFIQNIPNFLEEDDVIGAFSQIGEIRKYYFNNQRRSCRIKFENSRSFHKSLRTKVQCNGFTFRVNPCRPQNR